MEKLIKDIEKAIANYKKREAAKADKITKADWDKIYEKSRSEKAKLKSVSERHL